MEQLSYEQLKEAYKNYLHHSHLANVTIQTVLVDAFYIWRVESKELFWETVKHDEFELRAKHTLQTALTKHSKGNVHKLTPTYVSALRRFRQFWLMTIVDNPPNKKENRYGDLIIERPCAKEVKKYKAQWEELEVYQAQEAALQKLFCQFAPANTDLSDILLKTATLNNFYSTNIYAIYPVAQHIYTLNIDERLQKGDVTLVEALQKVNIAGKEKNFYSFATKYCSHHQPHVFPIYDRYVESVLCYFRDKHQFSNFRKKDLKVYSMFCRVLQDFQHFYQLSAFDLKDIDQYLWLVGKQYFPIKY